MEHPLDLERHIANLIADSIQPTLLTEIEILPWRRMHVLVVQVHPSALRPNYLKAEGTERGTYVRLGSTNRKADAALLQNCADGLSSRATTSSHCFRPTPKRSTSQLLRSSFCKLERCADRMCALSGSLAGIRTVTLPPSAE